MTKTKTKTKTKIKSFIFHTGYAESQSLACLLLTHNTGFDTVQEALQDIDRLLRSKASVPAPYLGVCCRNSLAKDSEAEYCSKCGSNLVPEEVNTGDMFYKHIHTVCGNAAYWDAFENAGWSHDTRSFDWPNHVMVLSSEDYASHHVHFFNPKPKNQILK